MKKWFFVVIFYVSFSAFCQPQLQVRLNNLRLENNMAAGTDSISGIKFNNKTSQQIINFGIQVNYFFTEQKSSFWFVRPVFSQFKIINTQTSLPVGYAKPILLQDTMGYQAFGGVLGVGKAFWLQPFLFSATAGLGFKRTGKVEQVGSYTVTAPNTNTSYYYYFEEQPKVNYASLEIMAQIEYVIKEKLGLGLAIGNDLLFVYQSGNKTVTNTIVTSGFVSTQKQKSNIEISQLLWQNPQLTFSISWFMF